MWLAAFPRFKERVAASLVWPFAMVMRHERGDGPSKVALPERHDAMQTFPFDGAYEALGVRIGIRGAMRCLDDLQPSLRELVPHGTAPLGIPIADEHSVAHERPIVGEHQRAGDRFHEQGIGMTCAAEQLDPPRGEIDDEQRIERDEPRAVHTSVVKKSAPAIVPQWARRNVCQEVGRSGTGGRPWAFRIRAIVERPTRWPTTFSAP